ncbi:heavy-metal-associated domain-containing protein [Psychroserpens damuponensis]|uniref:heavy-metal-associated domain-containing protein n=1 Tax=Psychroserpens damuponensis TaxID=943936 RepID=UPI00058B0640|nr:heavy metal-associated domain-containing protein [Psychroserpens damuponensis]
MTHTYIVTGMTCNGCKAAVEKALKTIDDVTDVSINLETKHVEVSMKHSISTEILKQALPSKYSITRKESKNVFTSNSSTSTSQITSQKTEEQSELKQLFPLFLIFGYILVGSFLMNYDPLHIEGFMLDFMGLFYIVFSFFKLLDLKGFPESFKMYDPLAKAWPTYGWVYPFIELLLGVMFLMRIEIPLALITTLVILGITTIGVTKTLLSKKSIQCACLGTALKLPMTKATFIENSIMIIMAIIMLLKTSN